MELQAREEMPVVGAVSRAELAERTGTDPTTLSRWHKLNLVEGVRPDGGRSWWYRPLDQAVVRVLSSLLGRGLRAPAALAAVSAELYRAGLVQGVLVVRLGDEPEARVDDSGLAAMEAMTRARAEASSVPLLVVPFGPVS